jgi:DNA polymerase-3 subunit delta'
MWSELLGHSLQRSWFNSAVKQSRLASTFLMVGPDGIGKRTFAKLVAKSMLCLRQQPGQMEPCGLCESCVQVDANTHPDLLQIEKSADASSLSIDKLVGAKENRMREGLCYELHIKPFGGVRRVAIIDDADTILDEAANSMLKTLEEPPLGSLIFLIGTNEQRQLSTIRSRSQIVRFSGLAASHVATLLLRNGILSDPVEASEVALMAGGSIGLATLLADSELRKFRTELHSMLAQRPMDFVGISKAMLAQSQSVGDEGAARRIRLKLLFSFASDFYRQILLQPTESRTSSAKNQSSLSIATAARAMDSCLVAQSEVDRNLTPAGLLESWASQQAELCQA